MGRLTPSTLFIPRLKEGAFRGFLVTVLVELTVTTFKDFQATKKARTMAGLRLGRKWLIVTERSQH